MAQRDELAHDTTTNGVVQLCLAYSLYDAHPKDRIYTHTDARLRKGFQVPAQMADRFTLALAYDMRRHEPFCVEELLGTRFLFFMELRSATDVNAEVLKRVMSVAANVVNMFVPPDTDQTRLVYALTCAGAGAATRARIVFDRVVVDSERALILHRAIQNALFLYTQGPTRQWLGGTNHPDDEPTMQRQWHETFPNGVYTEGASVPTVGSHAFAPCPGPGNHFRCPACMGNKVVPASREPLKLARVVDLYGNETDESKAALTKLQGSLREMATQLLLRRADADLSPNWRWFSQAPAMPRKRKPDGSFVPLAQFAEERTAQKQGTRTLVNTDRVKTVLRDVVRQHHRHYQHLNVEFAYVRYVKARESTITYPEYTVFVWGPGDQYCQNIDGFHRAEDNLEQAGRVYFEVTRKGIRQRCSCKHPVGGRRGACKDYKQEERPLDEDTKRKLGYGMDLPRGHGDFYHQLTFEWLPKLKQKIDGVKPAGNGRRR